MEKEEIIYKGQTFIKFTHPNEYVKYWCIEGFKLKERFEFINDKTNGLERVIEIYESEMPTGKLSYALHANYLHNKFGWCYPGMCDENIPEPKTYFEFKMFLLKDLLKDTESKHPDIRNVIAFLESQTSSTPTLF